jgi:hypothetical protein
MTKRYREDVDVTTDGTESHMPTAFRWRGRRYRIVAVLGHWREDAGYWSGAEVDVPQRDLWRVEARRLPGEDDLATAGARPGEGDPAVRPGEDGQAALAGGAPPSAGRHRIRGGARPEGVYELVREAETWRLDRVWD